MTIAHPLTPWIAQVAYNLNPENLEALYLTLRRECQRTRGEFNSAHAAIKTGRRNGKPVSTVFRSLRADAHKKQQAFSRVYRLVRVLRDQHLQEVPYPRSINEVPLLILYQARIVPLPTAKEYWCEQEHGTDLLTFLCEKHPEIFPEWLAVPPTKVQPETLSQLSAEMSRVVAKIAASNILTAGEMQALQNALDR